MRNAAKASVLLMALAFCFGAVHDTQALPKFDPTDTKSKTLAVSDNRGIRAYLDFVPKDLDTSKEAEHVVVDFSIIVLDAKLVPESLAARYRGQQPITVVRFVFYEENAQGWQREINGVKGKQLVKLSLRYPKGERNPDPDKQSVILWGGDYSKSKAKGEPWVRTLLADSKNQPEGFVLGEKKILEQSQFLQVEFKSWPKGDPAADGD
jgi:hypothetical protein